MFCKLVPLFDHFIDGFVNNSQIFPQFSIAGSGDGVAKRKKVQETVWKKIMNIYTGIYGKIKNQT
jgi:hypothetical protein